MQNNYDLETAKEVLRIRLSQMLINEKHKEGAFKIPIHLAMGHEAIAVAVDKIMEENDELLLSHRNIHYNLARTKALKPELNEYLLREDGLAGGQLGSMNLANKERNIVYASSILGNNLPVASGLALAKKVKGEKNIVIVETGDGAIEEGAFYESLLFMKSNNLAVLIVVENNGWSLATRIEERRCALDLIKIAESMGIRYEKLDSNNVYEYMERLNSLRDYSLGNNSPVIVEVELTTLGGWHLKTEENPEGRFINYHAGPAPKINLKNPPVIEESEKDPVFVLEKLFDKDVFQKASHEILENLIKEIE